MEFSDLLVILGSFQNIFNFCVSQKLLASCQQCSRCGCNMELTETTRVKDGYMWRCTNKRCRFGVVERGSQKVLLFLVPDRTRETLVHRLITTHIQPGTVIYSDQFTPYIHSTSWGISMYQSIIPRTLLTPTVVHTPIPSKACGPLSRKS